MTPFNMWKASPSEAREVYKKCSRSVVKIDVVRDGGMYYGSGFVWDRDRCLLVTCYHVIHDASDIRATFEDKTSFKAQVVYPAKEWDVAVLHVDAPEDKLWPMTAGDSDMVHIGDGVCAIGAPFGYQNSLSAGVISHLKQQIRLPEIGPIEGALQTDAALNPGSSGGPLIDKYSGKVIGMNATIEPSISHTNSGVGFAIPVNIVKNVVDMARSRQLPPNVSDACCIELPDSVSGESAEDWALVPCEAIQVLTQVSGRVSSTKDTKPNSGTEFSQNHQSHAKLEYRGHFLHNEDELIGYLWGERCSLSEGFSVIFDLMVSGKATMPDGNVLVNCGYCEHCDKVDVNILPCDYVDKFGLDHIQSTPLVSDEGWARRREKSWFRLWQEFYQLTSPKNALNDTSNLWETYEKKVQSYQFGPTLGNKSASYQSVDQLHTDIEIRHMAMRSTGIESSPNHSCHENLEHRIIRYLLLEHDGFKGYMFLEQLRLNGMVDMPNGDVLDCHGICKQCNKIVVDILPCDHVKKFGLDHIRAARVKSDQWEEMKSTMFQEYIRQRGLRQEISSAPKEKPVSAIADLMENFGKVTRPVLGVKFAPDQSVEQLGISGVLVSDAPSNGPAGKAPTKRDAYGRLASGDIITSVNDKEVTNGSDLYRILDQYKEGDKVRVEVLRGDQKEKIPVIIEPKPDES